MARGKSTKRRCSIYRLNASDIRKVTLKQKYMKDDGFQESYIEIEGIECRMAVGHIVTERAKWADYLQTATKVQLDVSNRTAAAVLLVPIDRSIFAVSYGMGFHLIDNELIEPGLGLQYVVRELEPDALKAVTQHAMNSRAQTDRRSIPGGAGVLEFGMADLGIAVSRVVGYAKREDGRKFTVDGADSLGMPLEHQPDRLIENLRSINVVLEREVEDPDLRMLTRMVQLKNRDPRKTTLDERLNDALIGMEADRIGLAWPWGLADDFTATDSVTLETPSGKKKHMDSISIDNLIEVASDSKSKNPMRLLRSCKVLLHPDKDSEEINSPATSALKWIAFETSIGDALYFFHDGRWFSMDRSYGDHVRDQCQEIISSSSGLSFIPWQRSEDKNFNWAEKAYNENIANSNLGYLLMDRKMVKTEHYKKSGFEACDLLGPGDELVHVKRLRAADEASHLFAQALVSTEALKIDGDAAARFRDKVSELSGGTRTAPDQVDTVVLAIGGRGNGPLNVDSLFTFSQVSLLRLVNNLRGRGVAVHIDCIPDVTVPVASLSALRQVSEQAGLGGGGVVRGGFRGLGLVGVKARRLLGGVAGVVEL